MYRALGIAAPPGRARVATLGRARVGTLAVPSEVRDWAAAFGALIAEANQRARAGDSSQLGFHFVPGIHGATVQIVRMHMTRKGITLRFVFSVPGLANLFECTSGFMLTERLLEAREKVACPARFRLMKDRVLKLMSEISRGVPLTPPRLMLEKEPPERGQSETWTSGSLGGASESKQAYRTEHNCTIEEHDVGKDMSLVRSIFENARAALPTDKPWADYVGKGQTRADAIRRIVTHLSGDHSFQVRFACGCVLASSAV